jgi:hypothetical protein
MNVLSVLGIGGMIATRKNWHTRGEVRLSPTLNLTVWLWIETGLSDDRPSTNCLSLKQKFLSCIPPYICPTAVQFIPRTKIVGYAATNDATTNKCYNERRYNERMLQRTNATTNECYNERMLQRTMLQRTMLLRTNVTTKNATTNDATANECYNKRMLQRTTLQRTKLQRTVLLIKSGCYNERGRILSADVARACAWRVGPSRFD